VIFSCALHVLLVGKKDKYLVGVRWESVGGQMIEIEELDIFSSLCYMDKTHDSLPLLVETTM